MKTFAQELVDFVTGLEKRFHCHSSGLYVHEVRVQAPQGTQFGTVTFRRAAHNPELDQVTTIAFDSSNVIRWAEDGDRNDATCGISVVCNLIGAITAILSSVQMYFNIVELSGDLVRTEVFADTGCICTEKPNSVKVALITANQRTNLITEFQSLI